MSNQEAIALLRNLEDSLDAYCELNEEGKTAFRMAIEALSCSEFPDGESEYCPFLNTDDDCVILLKKGICEGTWEEQYSKCPLVEEPERKKGEWIDYSDEGYVECPFCHSATNCDGNKDELHYCFSCGADMRGDNR